MPLPLAPLDPALFQHPKAFAARTIGGRVLRAIGREAATQAITVAALIARLLAWLLFWPMVLVVLGCIVGVVLFASAGMKWDAVQCAIVAPMAFALWTWLARAGR